MFCRDESESRSVVSESLQPHGLYSPWNSQARILEWVAFPFSGDLPNPRIEPRSPALQENSLPTELQAGGWELKFPRVNIGKF